MSSLSLYGLALLLFLGADQNVLGLQWTDRWALAPLVAALLLAFYRSGKDLYTEEYTEHGKARSELNLLIAERDKDGWVIAQLQEFWLVDKKGRIDLAVLVSDFGPIFGLGMMADALSMIVAKRLLGISDEQVVAARNQGSLYKIDQWSGIALGHMAAIGLLRCNIYHNVKTGAPYYIYTTEPLFGRIYQSLKAPGAVARSRTVSALPPEGQE